MTKLKKDKIETAKMIEYLEKSSEFAFELKCLELLNSISFECQHGGSYTDPLTNKPRQFDIRAEKSAKKLRIHCAIECKNIAPHFPLLVICVPRVQKESFHELILSYHPNTENQPYSGFLESLKNCDTKRINHPHTIYAVGDPVGKSCAQVGEDVKGSIVAKDNEVFEKWSQALSSAYDLVEAATEKGEETNDACLSFILPLLVVPDGTLWMVNYKPDGNRNGDPFQTERCSFYIGQNYSAGFLQQTDLIISHLEFVTFSGLHNLLKSLSDPYNSWFPIDNLTGTNEESD